jgi:MFS family permease
MLWPFLTIYMYDKLQIPLSTITLLLSIRAIFSVLSTTLVTPYMDRIGRKGMMVFSLIGASIVFIGMAIANSLPLWIVLISLQGTVLPIFGIGVNAMTADLVGSERRAPAYALIRAVTNAGIAIGPVIGGLLAVISFELTFLTTGIAGLVIAVLIFMMLPETNPHRANPDEKRLFAGGYGHILSDRYFLIFIAAIFLNAMAYSHMFSLLPVYASENFGLIQSEYSLVFTVNAVIVVLFQYQMTHFTNRFRPFPVIAVGAVFYVLGTLSVASGSTLQHFMLSMAIVTIGELIINPTAITLVANIAPENMRARYMGIFSLGYPIGSGLGPVVGGLLNDMVAPVAMWYGAAAMAFFSVIVFLILAKIWRDPTF